MLGSVQRKVAVSNAIVVAVQGTVMGERWLRAPDAEHARLQ